MKLDDLEQFLNSLNLELNEQQKIAIMKYKSQKDLLEELGSSIGLHLKKINSQS